jgi:hypothetical protein
MDIGSAAGRAHGIAAEQIANLNHYRSDFNFSDLERLVLCCGVDEALGLALWAHDMTVRSKIRTRILYFMIRVSLSLSYLHLHCGLTPGPKAGRRHKGEAGCRL